jgi:sortase A
MKSKSPNRLAAIGAYSWMEAYSLAIPWVRWLENTCWVVGVAALGWFLFIYMDTLWFQASQAHEFEAALQRTHTLAATVRPGDLMGTITIPRIGLSAVVLEGDDEKTLRRAVGHIPGTAYPDESGTVGLAGHRDTFFRKVGSLDQNDVVLFETLKGTYRYRVASAAVVQPQDVDVLRLVDRPALTLVTCYPFRFVGPAPQRFVVTAWQVPNGPQPRVEHLRSAKRPAD